MLGLLCPGGRRAVFGWRRPVPDGRRFRSVAFQLPELGLLTLAMLIPILSGGLNLAITFTANIAALVAGLGAAGGWRGRGRAWRSSCWRSWRHSRSAPRPAASWGRSSPIPARIRSWSRSSMMIFLRGLGEFLTRGGDISGFPPFVGRDRAWLVRRACPIPLIDLHRLRGRLARDPEPHPAGPDDLHDRVQHRGAVDIPASIRSARSCWSTPCPA